MRQIPPWTQAGLPGRPVVETSGGLEDVSLGRVVRGRNGKVIYFGNEQDARFVVEMASEFLGQRIERVFFIRKNGQRQLQYALCYAKGASPTKYDIGAIEAIVWMRLRGRGKVKKKKVAGLVASK